MNEAAASPTWASPGGWVASEDAVYDAGEGERRNWEPGTVAELRGRHRPTRTWVPRAD